MLPPHCLHHQHKKLAASGQWWAALGTAAAACTSVPSQPLTRFLLMRVVGGSKGVVSQGPLAKRQAGRGAAAAAALSPPPTSLVARQGSPQRCGLLVILDASPTAAEGKQAHWRVLRGLTEALTGGQAEGCGVKMLGVVL